MPYNPDYKSEAFQIAIFFYQIQKNAVGQGKKLFFRDKLKLNVQYFLTDCT